MTVQNNFWRYKGIVEKQEKASVGEKKFFIPMPDHSHPLSRRLFSYVTPWVLPFLRLFVITSCIAQQIVAAPAEDKPSTVPMASDGKGLGIIVVPKDAPPSVNVLADYFIGIVARSTGVTLEKATDDEQGKIAAAESHLFLGACRQTAEAGLADSGLPEEAYQIVTQGSSIYVRGEPAKSILRPGSKVDPWYDSDPLRWALNAILEKDLGVLWLWPGHLGTYVPRHARFSIPAENRTYQPRLKMRILVVATMRQPEEQKIRAEALEWVSNHQGGERENIPLGHGFNDWWEKYHEGHPDYFATPPAGEKQRPAKYIKLNLTNPKVLDQIAEDYQKAGKPKYWNVAPNDGSGFDVSAAVRAWDIPANQSVSAIWQAQANLTARYVHWWNMIYARLKTINPEVTLVTMAYSAYRTPPPPECPLTAKVIMGIVPSYRAYDVWAGWAEQADQLILRPNWGHYGANGPHLPLREMANYMKFAADHKMVGFYMDSIVGFWGTQGLNYYLMARLMIDPGLSAESIVKEYSSAFGGGSEKIEAYFQYWQNVTAEWAQGHKVNKVPEGRYDALIRENKIVDNPLIGPLQALPYIYTDEVLAKAFGLLDEADHAIEESDTEAKQRVDFLRQGLNELKATRDCIALGKQIGKRPSSDLWATFQKKADELDKLRAILTPSHVIWGGVATRMEDKIRIKIRPRNMAKGESTGDDQF